MSIDDRQPAGGSPVAESSELDDGVLTTESDSGEVTDSRADEPEDLPSGNEIIGTLFGDASLWPLLVVILGSLGAFGAGMLVLAFGDRNPFAAAALLLVAGMSADQLIRARRLPEIRNVAKLISCLWMAAIGFALLAVWSGIT